MNGIKTVLFGILLALVGTALCGFMNAGQIGAIFLLIGLGLLLLSVIVGISGMRTSD